jgi:RNA polymerase sigma-70 factor (ECF subfamily)
MRQGRSQAKGLTSGSRRQRQEARLISRAQAGDRRAMGQLYRRHVDPVYQYIYARVRVVDVAEDLTAQVFLKAVEGIPAYQDRGKPFLGWLYRIAFARVVDYYREQERRVEVDLVEDIESSAPDPEEIVTTAGDWKTAVALMSQLTDDQQDVLILRFIGEMPLADVAEILGKTIGAIKSLQHRGLASLARLWEQQQEAANERGS